MALWGNNDAVPYLYNGAVGGTVSVNYGTKVVTGTGTTFGSSGYAQVGDVIRIGFRGTGGTYFGDATIVAIASTVSLTIASTDGLSGAAIANTSYWVSELPQYTTLNPRFSEDSTFNDGAQGYKTIHTGTASTFAGIGVSVIPLDLTQQLIDGKIEVGDFIVNDSNEIPIVGIDTFNVRVSGFQNIGTDRYYVKAGDDGLPKLEAVDGVMYTVFSGTGQTITHNVTSVAGTYVSLGTTTGQVGIASDTLLMFESAALVAIGLGATISASISSDASFAVQRPHGGYDAQVVAVNETGVSTDTAYEVDHAGWVGVTTYVDNHGNLRVKKETLVAMSGITTGPAGAAGTAGGAYPWSDD